MNAAAGGDAATRQAIDRVWRQESARIVAGVARLVRDVGLAEELAHDALVAALEHWPAEGLPINPGAWLMATAKNRALDRLRQLRMHERKHDELAADLDALGAHVVPDFVDGLDAAREDDIGDDLLRLIFTACHPVLSTDARVALTLRLLGGLSTDEIARACLVPEATIAQRIVRAKRTLSAAQVPFAVPQAAERARRLDAVLEVIYLIFNEGYTATAGDDWMRPALCDEALRLARTLTGLMPADSEVLGLQALLELQAARGPARVDEQGRPVLLADQDRSRWDAALLQRGLDALRQAQARAAEPYVHAVAQAPAAAAAEAFAAASALASAQASVQASAQASAPHAARPAPQITDTGAAAADPTGAGLGPYALQAAIAACHARAQRAADTDWARIVALYDRLLQAAPSPVVALNRAVAVGMAFGPAVALPLVDALAADAALQHYPWLPAVQGDLLLKLDRRAEARAAFERAAGLTRNAREQALLQQRADALA